MSSFISKILPFLFLAQSLAILYYSLQIVYPGDFTTFQFIMNIINGLVPTPLNFLFSLLNLPFYIPSQFIYTTVFLSVFGITTLLIFLGLFNRSRWALYVLIAASLSHPLIGRSLNGGFREYHTANILMLAVVGLVYTGFFFLIRKNYH